MARLPKWIRCSLRSDDEYAHVQHLLGNLGLHTVCEDANCPNRVECWNSGTATMMILGDTCTRNCDFCAVASGTPKDPPRDEPERVAQAAQELGLRHLVLTSVTRDDLPDGGAGVFAECIRAVGSRMPTTTIELLIPDFNGDRKALETVLRADPDVLNHNIETVRRLQPRIRPQASYESSMRVLGTAAAWPGGAFVKSGLMVGLGESDGEVYATMEDLFRAGCRLLTIGQYLAPSPDHWPVDRYVEPDTFAEYARQARVIGFAAVAANPLVRSSYQAADMIRGLREEANA